MRITTLLAATALGSGAMSTATAETESRIRVVVPPVTGGAYRIDAQPEHRAALGIGTSATGTLRDTLGLLITSITACCSRVARGPTAMTGPRSASCLAIAAVVGTRWECWSYGRRLSLED